MDKWKDIPEGELQRVITPDDIMEEFILDDTVSDEELSESIFTCVDNYIDALCIDIMKDENTGLFDDSDSAELPFSYILDKVMEKVDTVEDIADKSYGNTMKRVLSLDDEHNEFCNKMDPDYCEEVNFSEITPEEFQLFDIRYPDCDADLSISNNAYDNTEVYSDANYNAYYILHNIKEECNYVNY